MFTMDDSLTVQQTMDAECVWNTQYDQWHNNRLVFLVFLHG